MKKLQNTNTTTMVKQNRSELKRHYTISVVPKDKGFQARVTLKVIGGGKNPRITSYSGISTKDAVCKILLKMAERLSEYKKMNLLKREICLNIYDSIMISIQELRLTTDSDVMKSATVEERNKQCKKFTKIYLKRKIEGKRQHKKIPI